MPTQLILLPNVLGEEQEPSLVLPQAVFQHVKCLDGLIAESEKGGRLFLKKFELKKPLQQFPIALLNEHTSESEVKDLLIPIAQGQTWGLISDAGMPSLADPGSNLVHLARKQNIVVDVIMGPTSITLALILSGFPSQKFFFHGYLEREHKALVQQLHEIESLCYRLDATQIFIETPYRNSKVLEIAVNSLKPSTALAVACDLGLSSQICATHSINSWKSKDKQLFHKRPSVFLITPEKTFPIRKA